MIDPFAPDVFAPDAFGSFGAPDAFGAIGPGVPSGSVLASAGEETTGGRGVVDPWPSPAAPLPAPSVSSVAGAGAIMPASPAPAPASPPLVTPVVASADPAPFASPPAPILLNAGSSGEDGAHSFSDANHCLFAWAAGHILGYSTTTLALIRGSLWHVAIAHRNRRIQAMQQGEDPERWYEPLVAVALAAGATPADERPAWTAEVELISETFRKYNGRYAFDLAPETDRRVIGVETVCEGWFSDPWGRVNADGTPRRYRWTQRLDCVIFTRGYRRVEDAKTTGSPITARVVQREAADPQFHGIAWLGRGWWQDTYAGAVLDLCSWATPRGKSASATDKQFDRPPAPEMPWMVATLPRDVVEIRDWIERLRQEQRDPWHWPRTGRSRSGCDSQFGICPFWRLCRDGPPAGGRKPDPGFAERAPGLFVGKNSGFGGGSADDE